MNGIALDFFKFLQTVSFYKTEQCLLDVFAKLFKEFIFEISVLYHLVADVQVSQVLG
jgi:hypothetical protein